MMIVDLNETLTKMLYLSLVTMSIIPLLRYWDSKLNNSRLLHLFCLILFVCDTSLLNFTRRSRKEV